MIGGGITNTLDLGAGQKIQDYLAGAGVSNQGPGGGTLYTQGQGFNPRPVIDTSSQQYQDLFEKYRPGIDGVYSSGIGPVTQNRTYLDLPSGQDMAALGYYDPNPMTREHKGPMMAQFMNNLYSQPASGDANLGFGSVENPLGPAGPGVGGVIPAAEPTPTISQQPIYAATGVDTTSEYSNLDVLNPNYIPGSNPFSPTDFPLFGEQEQQPGGGMPVNYHPDYTTSLMPEHNMRMPDGFKPGFSTADFDEIQNVNPGTDTTDSFGIGSNPIMNNPIAPMPNMPTAPNTQPGHSHDDLLSGIGKLFEQYFPQQGSQQINQPSPMFDAAGNSVPDGQTQSSQVFGNMITPNFGGGY